MSESEDAWKNYDPSSVYTHMTKDHGLSLSDYVYQHAGQTIEPTDLAMTGLTPSSLTVTQQSTGKEFEIPIVPALQTPRDVRPALVQMAQEAAAKRGVSPYQIKKYVPPNTLLAWFTIIVEATQIPVVAQTLVQYGLPNLALSYYYPKLGGYGVLGALAVAHLAEAGFKLYPQLVKYRVPLKYKVLWILSNVLDGFNTLNRFSILTKKFEH